MICMPYLSVFVCVCVGALADRHLLQIARRLGGDWQELAVALNMAEEDIANVSQIDNDPQQAAFQVSSLNRVWFIVQVDGVYTIL